MINAIYHLPITSSSGAECDLHMEPGRVCILVCRWDLNAVKVVTEVVIRCERTLHYSCTFDEATDGELSIPTYDEVSILDPSPFLTGLSEYQQTALGISQFKHLLFYVDDGPLYQIVCKDYTIEEREYPNEKLT